METIRELVLTMAKENSSWGLGLYEDLWALANMGHEVGRNTVKRILAEHGIEPAPARDKRTPWSTFVKAHWGAIAPALLSLLEKVTQRRSASRSIEFWHTTPLPVRPADFVFFLRTTRKGSSAQTFTCIRRLVL